jgi:hypothetical protein
MSFINIINIVIHIFNKIINLYGISKGQIIYFQLIFLCAPGGSRTLNDSSEDCCDIHFTTGAIQIIIHYFIKLSKYYYNISPKCKIAIS